MRLLTAVDITGPDDWCGAVPGELVLLGMVCAKDDPEAGGDGSCGCGRVFSGVSTGKATTAATVTEIDITREQLVEILRATFAGPHWIFTPDAAEVFADDMIATAEVFEVGTMVRRIRETDEVVPR
jgi:hypothetical protein